MDHKLKILDPFEHLAQTVQTQGTSLRLALRGFGKHLGPGWKGWRPMRWEGNGKFSPGTHLSLAQRCTCTSPTEGLPAPPPGARPFGCS
ncbi:hypothetical protein J6590_067306 [Homalodisca vitripennis]|nr:hypothetical protein J6590_067306 [Homalodisca vitripennis]